MTTKTEAKDRWQKEIPAEEGFYWVKVGSTYDIVELVWLTTLNAFVASGRRVTFNTNTYPLLRAQVHFWSEPLPTPPLLLRQRKKAKK